MALVKKNFWIEEEEWDKVILESREQYTSASEIVRRALREYTSDKKTRARRSAGS